MQKVLITGITGLLGRHLSRELKDNFEVYGLTSGKSNDPRIFHLDFRSTFVTDSLPRDIDIIFHLAQAPKHQENLENYNDIFRINTLSTHLLLEYGAQIGIKKFFFASSGSIYDSSSQMHMETDNYSIEAKSFYAKSKIFSEILVNSYSSQFQTITGRIFSMFGGNQRSTFLLPSLLNSIKKHKPILLAGRSGIEINPISAFKAATMIKFLIQQDCYGVYNLCGNESISIQKVSEIIGDTVGIQPVFDYVEETSNMLGSFSKLLKSGYVYKAPSLADEIKAAVLAFG